jgi:hypothetical protein
MATDIPGASVYGQAVELAKKRYQTRLADINRQRQSTMRTAGFMGDVNAETGLTTNMRTDPYNKYGMYQQLNRSQALRADEQHGVNIGRGLSGRGGLGAQNLSALRYDFGKEDADFGANLTDQLGALTRQQEEEKFGYDEALYQAQLAAAQSAAASGDYGYAGGEYGSEYGGDYWGDYGSDPGQVFTAQRGGISRGPIGTKIIRGKSTVAKKPVVKRNVFGSGGRAPVVSAKKQAPKTVAKKPAVKKLPAGARR